MPVHQAHGCPRSNITQGWRYKKFQRKESQNINSCHPLKLSNIVLSVGGSFNFSGKDNCYRLLFKIKIIFRKGRGVMIGVSFFISGT